MPRDPELERLPTTGPVPVPQGTHVESATPKGLALVSPQPVPAGSILEMDLLMGARPLTVMARVLECHAASSPGKHRLDVEFLAMAQVDRDNLTDFLTAVGA